MKKYILILACFLLASCSGQPQDEPAIEGQEQRLIHSIGADGVCRLYEVTSEGDWLEVPEELEEEVTKNFGFPNGFGATVRSNGHNGVACDAHDPSRTDSFACKIPDNKDFSWWWNAGMLTSQVYFSTGDALLYYKNTVAPAVNGTFGLDSSLKTTTDIVFQGLDNDPDGSLAYVEAVKLAHAAKIWTPGPGQDTGRWVSVVDRHDVWFTNNINVGYTADEIEAIACHEIGHTLGLGHARNTDSTCMRRNGPSPFKTLNQTEINKLASFSGSVGGQNRAYVGTNALNAQDEYWWTHN